MGRIKFALPLITSLLTAGCGTYVPGLEEPLSSPADGQQLVQAIAQNIDCEIRNAIGELIQTDKEEYRTGFRKSRQTAWLDTWGVQTTLTLQVNERGGINPSAKWLPPSPETAVFALAGAGGLSAEATRMNKIGSYYTVAQIANGTACLPQSRPGGLFLLQNDLKLREWLLDIVMLRGTGVTQIPLSKDLIQHQVTFEVISSGSLTPAWTLTRVFVNPDGSFLEAKRGRKHDLLITLGPADSTQVVSTPSGPRLRLTRASSSLAGPAASAHLASEIGLAVSNALRNAR
jgi:hypothetical protein